KGDGVAELVEGGDRAAGGALGVALAEVGTAELPIGNVVGEHVPDRCDDRVLDGDQGFERAAAGGQPVVAGLQVGVLGSHRAEGGEPEGAFEIRIAGADLGVLGAAGRLVVAGADPGPGGEVFGGGEPGHVAAGLRDDHFGSGPVDPGDGVEQGEGGPKGDARLLDPV